MEDFLPFTEDVMVVLVHKCAQQTHLLALHLETLGYIPRLLNALNGLVYFLIIGDPRGDNLYSNVLHKIGLGSIKYWIENYPDTLNSGFSKDFILEGIKLILGNNIFCFTGSFYRQENGTAMGTNLKSLPQYTRPFRLGI